MRGRWFPAALLLWVRLKHTRLTYGAWHCNQNFKKEMYIMQFRVSRLDFVVNGLEDIRLLRTTWDSLWTREDQGTNESVLVNVTVDDREPGAGVSLNFYAAEDVLERFLSILEHVGLKFDCEDFLPGLCRICRIERELAVLVVES